MEAALEQRPLIEGSATEVSGQAPAPAEAKNVAVSANEAGNVPAAPQGALPVVKDVMSQPCLLYTSPSPRDQRGSRMPSSA